MKNKLVIFFLLVSGSLLNAQKMPVAYTFGEKYNDRHKYSNLVAIADDGDGGSVMVRAYYQGLVLKPKGYLIEHYNKNLELVNEYNYKLKGLEFIDGYVKNGQLYLLFLNYNYTKGAYEYTAHRTSLASFGFTKETLLSIASDPVDNALDKNYYNRNFSSGFTTSVLFDDVKSAFAITTHFKKKKTNQHYIYVFNAQLDKLMEHDFSAAVEEKNYAFENMAVSPSLNKVYLTGKAYFKKKRFSVQERKFQYELVQLSGTGIKTQSFTDPGKYPEALTPLVYGDKLFCVGFYSDRKDNRYNGITYFNVSPNNLAINSKKYNPFSKQFMDDKFGRGGGDDINNLVFKNVAITPNNDILFNAEEYFVTSSVQSNSSGGRLRVERFHHNDIVSVKLDVAGNLVWARNINKSEVTQNDGAYASYSSFVKGSDTYFFISTASENPQLLGGERLIFKQGLSRNRNVFLIRLNGEGKMDFEKIIDDKEARLPLMVSQPLKDNRDEEMLFYAKRGSKKQLVKVSF
ncbi:hypothetical protein [Costertonia aggregata]|uniref:Uncharacterized protein n=1 Tax=Costertonia aggregata TaxID=343403 RepID=A0A7H9AP39_9FLAO|nr:hypothetical protein [Costertonia aggregata]QLG45164.1 hypothetical protein HYG79_07310 [Costertonia aggregata]